MTLPVLLSAGSLVDINPGLVFWTLVTFGILALLLRWKAWGPILSTIEAREKGIRDALDAADAAKSEAEQMITDHKLALEAARKESTELVRQARAEVSKSREELMAKAKSEADTLLVSARKQIEEEKNQALAEVRVAVVDLSITMAGLLLKSQMDEAQQKKLVEGYLKDLPSAKA